MKFDSDAKKQRKKSITETRMKKTPRETLVYKLTNAKKRKTVGFYRRVITTRLLPCLEDLSSRLAQYKEDEDDFSTEVTRPASPPILVDDWKHWHDDLIIQRGDLITKLNSVYVQRKSSFPVLADVLFSISSFLLPPPCRSFGTFRSELSMNTMVLRRVSKTFAQNMPYSSLLKLSLRFFRPARMSVYHHAMVHASNKQTLMDTFRKLNRRFDGFLSKQNPYFLTTHSAMQLFGLSHNDMAWTNLQVYHKKHPRYEILQDLPGVKLMAYAAICCQPPPACDGLVLREMYYKRGLISPHAEAKQNIADAKAAAANKALLHNQRASKEIMELTGWPVSYFKTTREWKSLAHNFAIDAKTWFTPPIQQTLAMGMVRNIIHEAIKEQLKDYYQLKKACLLRAIPLDVKLDLEPSMAAQELRLEEKNGFIFTGGADVRRFKNSTTIQVYRDYVAERTEVLRSRVQEHDK